MEEGDTRLAGKHSAFIQNAIIDHTVDSQAAPEASGANFRCGVSPVMQVILLQPTAEKPIPYANPTYRRYGLVLVANNHSCCLIDHPYG